VSTDQVLFGVGLILLLAVGSQVLASRLRIPALIILLPVGFVVGALTADVNPQRLLGTAFQPLVSLAVGVILYDAGLALDLAKLRGNTRRVTTRLITVGVVLTWLVAAALAGLLFGLSVQAALMLGAILVVSGPTVVGPLLRFIRPTERLQRVLAWEGSLVDPVGAVLGAVVFHAVLSSAHRGPGYQLGQFFLFPRGRGRRRAAVALPAQARPRRGARYHQPARVRGGGHRRVRHRPRRRRADSRGPHGARGGEHARLRHPGPAAFFETLVQLIIGVLFVSISATVTPASLRHLVLPTLGLVAVLVLVTRPLVAFLATVRTDLTTGERRFVGWMAPRGIVAASTASTFGEQLAAQHVGGAAKILPVTFLVIVATVALYGLTAVPVARRLDVTRPARTRPLLVGGDPWVIDLGCV